MRNKKKKLPSTWSMFSWVEIFVILLFMFFASLIALLILGIV